MRTRTALFVVATAAAGLLSACGSSGEPTAKAQSFEEALGMDQDSMLAREAKVQEKIRTCMKAEGFEYIPVDPSQSNMQFKVGGPDSDDPAKLRKEGYGVTAMPKSVGAADRGTNPNDAIVEALSDADREAYEMALFGRTEEKGPDGGGAVIVRRTAGRKGDRGPGDEDTGCAGKAQREVPGGPEQFMDAMDELKERIGSDPRMVAVERAWKTCMSRSGYDWDTPGKIRDYLFGKLEAALGGQNGEIHFDPDMAENAAVTALHQEELAIAKVDADCRVKTKYQAITTKVRDEAQQRFLDEHPNLGK